MKEEEDPQTAYPPPTTEPHRGSYYPAPSESRHPLADEERNVYNPHDAPRPSPYSSDARAVAPYPSDPRQPVPYPPPSWHHLPPGYPPPHHQYPDPAHPAYHYHPGPPADMSQPPQPRHPDPYRLPPPYPYPGYGPPHAYAQPPPPAPRQRTAIACKYCRKRKIRCSGYESSPDGRCNNCVRFNQSCLFHPVSSQAAFVPAQAVYPHMPNPRGEPPPNIPRGDHRPQGAYPREGESPPVLYGAHGIPLAPATGQDHHAPYHHPPGGYPPQSYPMPPHPQAPAIPFDHRAQGPPRPQSEDGTGRKRGPPDDDAHNETARPSQSPHPSSRPRFSNEPRNSTGPNGYAYPDPANVAPTSPSTSSTSYQGGYPYSSSASQSARRNSPQSAHSFDSPRTLPIREDGKSTPPVQPGSAPGSANGRGGMSLQGMLGESRVPEGDAGGPRRHRDDTQMLSKLDGKK